MEKLKVKPAKIILAVILAVISLLFFLNAFQIPLGLHLGQRDYNYITELRDRVEADTSDREALSEIIERTKHRNSLTRTNAVAVIAQLSHHRSTGKQLHDDVYEVLVFSLDDKEQSVVRCALQGLENLGPYASTAIPQISEIADHHEDAFIRMLASETLAVLIKEKKTEPGGVVNDGAVPLRD